MIDSSRFTQSKTSLFLKYDETSKLLRWVKVGAYLSVNNSNMMGSGLSDGNEPIFLS